MSYKTQADLADDGFLRRRIIACAAAEGIADPEDWATIQRWVLSAVPGWDAAYASAITANIDQPGNAEAVISDAMILSAVQAINTFGGGA